MIKITKNLNKACCFFYEFSILLALPIFALAPLHSMATRHFNITRIIDSSTVSFVADNTGNIAVGDILPIYRFNPRVKTAIGRVKVSRIINREIICSLNPEEFNWPMGRHGRVIEAKGPKVKVDVGSRLGFKTGDSLILFKGRARVGTVKLTEVYGSYSWGQVINSAVSDLEGLTASEFTIATQAVFFKNRFLSFFEIAFILLIIAAYSYLFILRKQSLFVLLGKLLRSRFKLMPRESFVFILNLALCLPFVWLIVTFTALSILYLFSWLINTAGQFFNAGVISADLRILFYKNAPLLYGLGIIIYLYIFFKKKSSPILIFWDRVGFRVKENRIIKGRLRDILIWFLHLIIAYAFAKSLFAFLRVNLDATLNLIWQRNSSFQCAFSIMRYLLWSATIIGCLVGYGHSILGYLWGKRIRNLDFTLMGWATNAVCYGPLLGIVIWQMVPSYVGRDPIITQGPLYCFVIILELLLNLLYTLSIWNLGIMFGVMTDKGVRTSGFYGVVRHPSYTLESMMFVIMLLNGLSTYREWLAVALFFFIYYARSEREDNFMSNSNPGYIAYKQATRFKFIPGVY